MAEGTAQSWLEGWPRNTLPSYLLVVVDINYGSLQAIIWIEGTYPPGAKLGISCPVCV